MILQEQPYPISDHGGVRLSVLRSQLCGSLSASSTGDEALHRFALEIIRIGGAPLLNGWLRGHAESARGFPSTARQRRR